MRILLIEDEPDHQLIVKSLIECQFGRDVELHITSKIQEAKAWVKQARSQDDNYDVVIADWNVRGGNTAGFAKICYERNIPLFYHTAEPETLRFYGKSDPDFDYYFDVLNSQKRAEGVFEVFSKSHTADALIPALAGIVERTPAYA